MTGPSDERRCGYTVIDDDGIEQPCDRPATGWRWYQDVGDHEDLLDAACGWHENEGGNRIHRLTTALADMTREARLSRESTEKAVRRAEKAEADLRVLREGIEALAKFYETSVRYEQTHPRHIIRRLRALLGEAA